MARLRFRPESLAVMAVVMGLFTLITMFLTIHRNSSLGASGRLPVEFVRKETSDDDDLESLFNKGDGLLDWDDLDPIRNFPNVDDALDRVVLNPNRKMVANSDTVGKPLHDSKPENKHGNGHFRCETLIEQPAAHAQSAYVAEKGTDCKGGDLLAVRTKDVNILKRMCDALDECRGFNSNGWLKKSIGSRYQTRADLYVKQVPQPDETVYLSYQALQDNYGKDYTLMSTKLKIYVYDLPMDKTISAVNDYKYGVEQLFINLLLKSSFITKDPDEATLFFIPFRCTAYRKTIPDRQKAQVFVEKMVQDAISHIKSKHNFWDRTLGADHFYICAHDLGASLTGSADPNLQKNAIALVNTADYEDVYYIPHKDISLPPHPSGSLAARGQGGTGTDPKQRTILAFIAGNMDRGRIRPSILDIWSRDPDFRIFVGHLSDEKYQQYLKTSKFCLCPRGFAAWSPRLMDALWFGCVPVIMSDYYDLPLEGLIDWSSFSVIVSETKVKHLKTILQSVSPEQLADMQTKIRHVYAHFTWNDPPRPYDAFNSVMFQLWKRRTVVRYKRDL